ncbi:GTPase domain-containing protein [Paenibacillus sp. UNCCL52]|uniref:GTPase domain-containing protein n=1 Tax=Paenibacillus sp. UNCCL52 TaxID=1449064 RepID=UPI0015A5DE9A|nr:GTPase domain-containing protein [Paenibacillus sp. UNCCL52]
MKVNSFELTLERVKELLIKQASAPIIAIAGPSGSTKSTTLAEILLDEFKKLLSQNIGSKQTSLFDTLLMLNSDIEDGKVIIQIKTKSADRITYKHQIEFAFGAYLYDNRDDLDELEFDETVIKQVLNPTNRAYHFYEHVDKQTREKTSAEYPCPTVRQLQDVLLELFEQISPDLVDRVRQREKEAKTVTPRPKKERLYQLEISNQLEQHPTLLKRYYDWFDQLHQYVLNQIKSICQEIEPGNYIFVGEVNQNEVQELVKQAYNKQSPYSIAVEQFAFMVQPSMEFSKLYREAYRKHQYENKVLRLNLLDTPGLTQVSEDKSDIQDALDRVLSMNFNALMFLCGSSRSTTEFMVSQELLISSKKKLDKRPLLFVRTKADTVIDAALRDKSRAISGSGQLTPDFIKREAEDAYHVLIKEVALDNKLFAKEGITPSITGRHVDFLCMELDRLGTINDHLSEKITTDKLYHLLIDLSLTVHNMYSPAPKEGVKHCVRSTRGDQPAMQVSMNGYMNMITDQFAQKMVELNERNKNSYLKYIDTKYAFHGRSVSTYVWKHRYGIGHTTNASVYENFHLHICSMIERWVNEFFSDWKTNFDIDFSNLNPIQGSGQAVINEAPSALTQQFIMHRHQIVRSIAKSFSYDLLKVSFEKCYLYTSYDSGFRKNMSVFNETYSNLEYWQKGLEKLLKIELEALLAKMYLYE